MVLLNLIYDRWWGAALVTFKHFAKKVLYRAAGEVMRLQDLLSFFSIDKLLSARTARSFALQDPQVPLTFKKSLIVVMLGLRSKDILSKMVRMHFLREGLQVHCWGKLRVKKILFKSLHFSWWGVLPRQVPDDPDLRMPLRV